jgi:hypothetical protein
MLVLTEDDDQEGSERHAQEKTTDAETYELHAVLLVVG